MAKIEISRTELVWPGKYDDHGDLAVPPRVNLPFQIIETINESRATREARKRPAQTSLFDFWGGDEGQTFEEGWRNKLIWGDNALVMSSLLQQYAGKIDLIYIDPPFATGTDFSFTAPIGERGDEVFKAQSVIEEKAYRDTWGSGLESYLAMMLGRIRLIRDLLSDDGSLFVHCDWRVNSYLRVILDEVFGRESFRNEIIWRRAPNLGRQAASSQLGRVIDTILCYTKTPGSEFAGAPPMKNTPVELDKSGKPAGAKWDPVANAFFTTAPRGDYTDASIDRLRAENRVYESSTGTLSIKYFLRLGEDGRWYKDTRVDTLWDDYDVRPLRHRPKDEDLNYDTQKPEGLLERVVTWASAPGDLVADFFCGSGTTLAVAEKLGRRWIACDLGRFAIHTTRKRLMGIEGCKPFEVLNLGRYERQYWQASSFQGRDPQQVVFEYLAFILKLYGATPVAGMQHVHGKKGGALVHVGAVDAPVTIDEVMKALDECVATGQKELHVLGWEWEMGLNDTVDQLAVERGVRMKLLAIPREVMEAQAVERGDIRFFELAHLDCSIDVQPKRQVDVGLAGFALSGADAIDPEVLARIGKWSDFVDYWAIDWDFKNDTFVNGWVAYRTKRERRLALTTDAHRYEAPGTYRIAVKVVDIFGNDTTKVFPVEVR